jgi:tripartite ATP-independent transporter DctM subunit
MLWTFFGTLFGLLLSGVWISVALGLTAIVIMQFWGGGIALLGSAAWSSINRYSLCALPGFIFLGQIILVSGLSVRMYDSVLPLMARLPGKLLQSNIVLSAMFAAVLGSSTANAAIVGSVAIPELRKRKYNERLTLGTVCAGGTLALLIPPSNGFIIYGVMADTSIAALFAAGTIPGIIMALLFMIAIGVRAKLTPGIAPSEEKGLPFKETLLSLLKIWPLVIIMFACVGTIYLGWTTPVEGAGVGALTSIIMGRLFGKLGWQQIRTALIETTEISAMIFFLVLGAMLMSVSISELGVPRAIVHAIGELQMSPLQIVTLILIMYLIMGCFLDGISMLLVTLPFVVPIIAKIGVDFIWFGVVVVIMVEVGQITPPVGLNLFVTRGIAGPQTTLSDIFMGSLPLVIMQLLVIVIITIFPNIATVLPSLLGLI